MGLGIRWYYQIPQRWALEIDGITKGITTRCSGITKGITTIGITKNAIFLIKSPFVKVLNPPPRFINYHLQQRPRYRDQSITK